MCRYKKHCPGWKSIVLKERIHKSPDRAEAQRDWNYPFRVLEESVVNALYQRNWEGREPVEVWILPGCIEIVNQGGSDRNGGDPKRSYS